MCPWRGIGGYPGHAAVGLSSRSGPAALGLRGQLETDMPRDVKPTTDQPPKASASRRIPLIVGVVAVVSVGFWIFGPEQVVSDPAMTRLAP
jgi:hypothetical protein